MKWHWKMGNTSLSLQGKQTTAQKRSFQVKEKGIRYVPTFPATRNMSAHSYGWNRENKKGKKSILFSGMGKLQNLSLLNFFFPFKHLNASLIGNVLKVNVEISSTLISLLDRLWLERINKERNDT